MPSPGRTTTGGGDANPNAPSTSSATGALEPAHTGRGRSMDKAEPFRTPFGFASRPSQQPPPPETIHEAEGSSAARRRHQTGQSSSPGRSAKQTKGTPGPSPAIMSYETYPAYIGPSGRPSIRNPRAGSSRPRNEVPFEDQANPLASAPATFAKAPMSPYTTVSQTFGPSGTSASRTSPISNSNQQQQSAFMQRNPSQQQMHLRQQQAAASAPASHTPFHASQFSAFHPQFQPPPPGPTTPGGLWPPMQIPPGVSGALGRPEANDSDSRKSSISSSGADAGGGRIHQGAFSSSSSTVGNGSRPSSYNMAPRPQGFDAPAAPFGQQPPTSAQGPAASQPLEPATAVRHVDFAYGQGQPERFQMKKEPVDDIEMAGPVSTREQHSSPEVAMVEENKVDHRKRKRNRTIQSCLPCHQNKRKCDRKRPCSRCTALSLTGSCVYEVDVARDPNDPEQAENDHLRSRIAELEQVVRELRAKATRSNAAAAAKADDTTPASKKRKLDEGTPGSAKANALALETTSTASVGTTTPKSSSDERVRVGQAPYNASRPGQEMVGDVHGRSVYVGEPGGRDLLRQLAAISGGPGSVPEDAAFKGVFPDTSSTFPFTTIWSPDNFSGEIIGLLPNAGQADILWDMFDAEVAMFFSAWHLPSFKAEFQAFFRLPDEQKVTANLGQLSMYLMVCALGIMLRASQKEIIGEAREPDNTGGEDITTNRLQSELYLSGAYHALRLCSFMSSPTIQTVQSQVMISVFLLMSERASDTWPVLGSLIRQAIAIGLNIDPARHDPHMSLKEAEIRRRIWWTIAGLDCLICLSLGRPTAITYWSTELPQDRADETLVDGQGTAADKFPPLNALSNEVTSFSYHVAYFALTIPSIEILERIFQRERRYRRSGTRGWFQAPSHEKSKDSPQEPPGALGGKSTYQDAVDLDADIVNWYRTIPRGIYFDPDNDTPEEYLATRSAGQINQTLGLNVKTSMIRLILHRPYLRADPAAYPRSSAICWEASHTILAAYKMMHATNSSIAWSWWTMSLRAFHSSAVCAFLAARQPGLAIADQCLSDIRGALNIFQGRVSNWPKAHPVQGHLVHGLVALEHLASTAIQRHHQKQRENKETTADPNKPDMPTHVQVPDGSLRSLSSIPAFPLANTLPPTPGTAAVTLADLDSSDSLGLTGSYSGASYPTPPGGSMQAKQQIMQGGLPSSSSSAVHTDMGGLEKGTDLLNIMGSAPDTMSLPHFWAEVFNIPLAPNAVRDSLHILNNNGYAD